MTFAQPYFLLLLLLLPLLIIHHRRQRRKEAINFPSLHLFNGATRTWRQRLLFLLPLFLYLALACLIICLARPQMELHEKRDVREGIAIQMLVDVSSSMDMDMQTPEGIESRLEVAKKVMIQFVAGDGKDLRGRTDDKIGLMSFARYSDAVCPLTLGHDALVYLIDELSINERPNEDGTAYGDAIALAAAKLKSHEKEDNSIKSKVILLLTDGENNCGERMPMQSAALAKKWGIRIYCVSLQEKKNLTTDGASFFKPKTISHSDRVLDKIAKATGGIYLAAHDMDSLVKVYKKIDQLEKTKMKEVDFIHRRDVFMPFAISALFLLLLRYVLSSSCLLVSP